MARVKVTLDRREVGVLLRTAFGDDVAELANRVAAAAGGRRKGVRVRRYTTDRQKAAVSVPAARQAKDGALSKAAAAVGLTIRGNL
ncbi:hypothetical protein IU501_23050 [Nocardia otitidiscaviarum]|uniref:hypothetical protein n=1 Tax=Nocardia TaxID=1817 RepID=UPI00189627DB|nr:MULTISPECIES: hypothetical protein [Nocardia]MBF6135873.1 hypothetical protein [Nocardia otitidiscaviarum]